MSVHFAFHFILSPLSNIYKKYLIKLDNLKKYLSDPQLNWVWYKPLYKYAVVCSNQENRRSLWQIFSDLAYKIPLSLKFLKVTRGIVSTIPLNGLFFPPNIDVNIYRSGSSSCSSYMYKRNVWNVRTSLTVSPDKLVFAKRVYIICPDLLFGNLFHSINFLLWTEPAALNLGTNYD